MSRITDVIQQKDLDLDFNSAKILASPFDYSLSERILCRNSKEINNWFNIFNKSNSTDRHLAYDCLQLNDYQYITTNPHLKLSTLYPTINSARVAYDAYHKLGMCGYFIKYNNLNLDEDTFLNDFEFLMEYPILKTISNLKGKNSYLRALEFWYMKNISKSSLIPNLMYLATEFYNESLEDLENIKFAEKSISRNVGPILPNYVRDMSRDSDDLLDPGDCIGSAFFLRNHGRTSKDAYDKSFMMFTTPECENFYRLGIVYSIVYGVEILYNFYTTSNEEIKNTLEHLLSLEFKNDTFCSKYLYNVTPLGSIEINPDVKDCFDSDNVKRFGNIRDLLLKMLSYPDLEKNILSNIQEFTLPIIFMRMISSMHSYAYQTARVKHLVLLYTEAKNLGVLDVEEFQTTLEHDELLTNNSTSDNAEDVMSNELLDLSTVLYDNYENTSKDLLEQEKMVGKKDAVTGPTLDTLDSLKKDLHSSKYIFDINYVKNDTSCKSTYDSIATSIKMLTYSLTKQIKEIKTYNKGGKQSGLLVGKLDKKNLWKYKTDHHIFYNNYYKLKEMDLAFGCILDESGSMCGEKIKNGRIVMILLHEVLNSLGINHSIIGHTSDKMYQSTIYKYYQFKEEAYHSLEKPYSLTKASAKCGNCDSGALYYMQTVMKKVRNKDKIVIIFSDGEPSECTDKDLTDQVKAMEKDGIHVIGVGIKFDSIKEYYPDNANGKNLKEMTDIVISILKRYVLEKKES